jgi:phospholipid/cholesterol/gamma-HCH transport system substrate-binding protein
MVFDRASAAVENLKTVSESITSVLSAFRDDVLPNITDTAKNVADITGEVKNGDGTLHALVYGGAEGQNPVTNVATAAKDLGALAREVKTGNGFLHDLIYGDSASERGSLAEIMSKFTATAENLRLASDALARGSGTLGALLIDPQLYENLVEVTDGAKRSFILRKAIRSSLQGDH